MKRFTISLVFLLAVVYTYAQDSTAKPHHKKDTTAMVLHKGEKSSLDTAKKAKDSISQPTAETALLTAGDIRFLHDSVVSAVPYLYAPAMDVIFKFLDFRLQQRAAEYLLKQTKKP